MASPEYSRSLKAALVPPQTIGGDTVPNVVFGPRFEWMLMPYLAVANSMCMDALARRLVSLHLKYYVMDSLPFPRWSEETPIARELGSRALRLTCTSAEMVSYWNKMAHRGWVEPTANDLPPNAAFTREEREQLQMEIEAIVALDVYGLSRDEFETVIDSFDHLAATEAREFGEFRTKRLALAEFDRRSARTLASSSNSLPA